MAQLKREDVIRYLDERKAQGFNTILVNLLEHKFASNAPSNIYGDPPFTTPGDYSTPNEPYFAYAEWVLRQAAQRGFVVLLAPSYMGYGGGDEGWYKEMKDNGPDRMRAYGRYLAQRFAGDSNVIWVQGGDYNPPERDLADSLAAGLAEGLPDALQTAHTAPETSAVAYWGDKSWLALNDVYTYSDVYSPSIDQYETSDLPVFLLESTYENEHDATPTRLRTQAYQAVLSGAFGQVFGNNPIWHFDGPGLYDVGDLTWQGALDSPGARSMTHLRDLLSRFAWWTLRPDTENRFLTEGVENGTKRGVASVACDRSFALVYLPTKRTITLDLGQLRGTRAKLTWYDPSNGASAHPSTSSLAGTEEVQPPPHNSDGSDDWILIVETT
jgi:hypothetical protein